MKNKIKEIAEGWANYMLGRQKIVSAQRMKICGECEYDSAKNPEAQSLRPDRHCTKCGCTLAAKTRSLDSECPIGLWKAVKIEKDEESKKEIRD